MAQENLVINGKIVLDEKGMAIPMSNMRKELAKANKDLQTIVDTFGATSVEAQKAAERVAELRDNIGDTKALVDNFNPDEKFNVFNQALMGVQSGFQSISAAQSLFGEQSEVVTKTLEKLQGVMDLSNSVQSILAAKDAFLNLGAMIKNASIFQKVFTAGTMLATKIQTAFGVATTGTSTAFKVLRGAIISTGIGALVVALGFVVEKIIAWTSSTEDQEKAQNDLTEAIDKTNKELEDNLQNIDYVEKAQVLRAKIAGKTEDEITQITKDANSSRVTILDDARLKAEKIYNESLKNDKITAEKRAEALKNLQDADKKYYAEKEKNSLYDLQIEADNAEKSRDAAKTAADKKLSDAKDAAERYKEAVKAAEDLLYETRKKLMTAKESELKDLEKKFNEDKKVLKAAGYKDFSVLEEAYQKEKAAIVKKYADEEKAKQQEYLNELNAIYTEVRLNGIKDANQKEIETIKQKYVDELAKITENEKYTAEQKLELKKALLLKEQQELDALEEQRRLSVVEKNLANLDALYNDNLLKLSIRKQALDAEELLLKQSLENNSITEEQYTEKNKALTEKRIQIGELEKQSKEAQLQGIAGALQSLSQLAGEQTGVGKALAVASTAISTYSAAQKAYESAFLPVPNVSSPVLGAVYAGIAVAQGLMSIKKILAVKVPGSSGGGSMPSMSSMAPPMAPQMGSTIINQSQVNQIGNAATRAYVVESDVTGQQQRIERLNRAARIN